MSKIALTPNASGTGIFTIASPNSNTDRTLSLPDETGTVLTSGGAIDVNASAPADSLAINASGNVGIGTSSPTSKLHVYGGAGTNIGIQSSAGRHWRLGDGVGATNGSFVIYDYTGSAKRLEIDASGNLLVGTASGTQKLAVVQSDVSNNTASFRNINASFAGDMVIFGADRNTTNNSFYPINYYNYGASAYKFRVADSGNVTNTNNSYGAISDAKLKENITDATPKLEKLNQVRIVNYNIIGNEQKQLGVIAQELELIFPGMVDESPDTDEEGNDLGTTTKSVKYSVFVPMLIKAIQEQQAIIESLTARIEALEGAA